MGHRIRTDESYLRETSNSEVIEEIKRMMSERGTDIETRGNHIYIPHRYEIDTIRYRFSKSVRLGMYDMHDARGLVFI